MNGLREPVFLCKGYYFLRFESSDKKKPPKEWYFHSWEVPYHRDSVKKIPRKRLLFFTF